MKRFKTLFFALLNLFFVYGMAFAQYRSSDSTGLFACGACGGSFLFSIIAIAVINIAILVWVAKDSKARGMGSSIGWLILVFFYGIYRTNHILFFKTQG